MKPILTFLTAVLLARLSVLHAADAPSMQPPQHLGPPRSDHSVTNRAFTGIPSMAVAPKNRLWATWYAGVTPAEDLNNYVVVSTSSDGGATWTEVMTVDPDAGGPVRSFDPELWVSPNGRLFLFWSQMEKGRRDAELGVWCVETDEPDAAQPAWSQPRRIGDGVMMCKPLALSSGEWVLPISRWREHDESAQFIVSTDAGRTWTRRGGCNVPKDVRQFDEHMFVERRDGSLWLLVRTTYGIGESVSTDRGKTWPELKPSGILHTPSRFFIRRLASGNLLTLEEVRALEEGMAVSAPTRARREVLNYFAALRHVEKQAGKKRLTHEDIFRLHAIIAGEVMDQGEPGRYRTIRFRVGQWVPPPPEEVSGLMFELLEWWNKDAPGLTYP